MERWRRRHRGAVAAVVAVLSAASVAGIAQAVADPVRRTGVDRDVPCGGQHWVAAWTSAPQSSSTGLPDDGPIGLADGVARTFDDQTVRMIVTPHAPGSALRVHLSNRFGRAPVTMDAVKLALPTTGASVAPGTIRTLLFGGEPAAVVPAGGDLVSDPVFVDVRPFQKLAVTFHVVGSTPLDYHQWAQQTGYLTSPRSGDHADDASGAAFVEETTSAYAVSAVDVLTTRATGTVVAIGDSITDGIGSSPNTDRRWPDALARRVLADGHELSIVDAGIAGNHLSNLTPSRAIGPAIVDRIRTDALSLAGVTDVVVLAGVNDIFTAAPGADITDALVDGYRAVTAAAHRVGVRVAIATITPADLAPDRESVRLAVNDWIRTAPDVDRVLDFDAVVRDPVDASIVRPTFDAAMAHLTDAGYETVAASIDLDDLQGTGCSS